MKFIRITVLFLLVFGAACSCYSQKKDTIEIRYKIQKLPFGLSEKVPVYKPMVALALSGGGARGLSQIGILKAFEDQNIPIDIIVGTSMGSIIGGLYSAGYSTGNLDSIATETNWDAILSMDRGTNRRELFIDQKITEDKAILTLRLDGLTPIIPTSISSGQRLSNYFNLLTLQAPLHVSSSFDDLRIRFRAVCTNLVTGDAVIISEGHLSQAMRASSSVSFLLPPVKIDSLILVDGGLVANIPADIASELADLTIAVNTTSTLHSENELEFPWFVADQIVSIPMKLLNENQLSNADIVIEPDLEFSANNFENIDSLIEKGYKAGLEKSGQIKEMIDSVLINNLKDTICYYQKPVFRSELNNIQKIFEKDFSGYDSVSNHDLLSKLYYRFETNDYADLKIEITEYDNSSVIDILGKLNPIINKINLYGLYLVEKETADSIISFLKGKPFNSKTLSSKIIEILRLYRNQGYSLAELDHFYFNESDGVLDLYFDEGKISRFIIEGNTFTSESVIEREFTMEEGAYFSYKDVERGLINLRSTNLFEDIILTVKKDGNQNIVVLRVLERNSSLIRFGFRIDNEKKAQASIDIRDENIWGTGTELGLLLSGGARNRAYILEHKSNRIFDTYFTYKINAFYQFDDAFAYMDDSVTNPKYFSRSFAGEYRQIYYGGSLSLGTQVERFGNLIFTGKYEIDEIKNKQSKPVEPAKNKIVSLKISSTVDTQDKYPYPDNGFYFYGSYETAQKIFGGDIGYTNINFDYRYYFTLNGVNTFSPRIMMGFADKTLPLSQQYSLGGQNSFFGMREDEYRGRQIMLASLEYRYELPFDLFFNTYLRFRYDMGSIWNIQEEIKFKDLKHGLGATLSLDTPIGPADFSVGRSFIFNSDVSGTPISYGDVFLYFSIGFYY